jgi:hypothetical protein
MNHGSKGLMLCINQADSEERNSQVGQMRDIYPGAERVIVWLGEECTAKSALVQCFATGYGTINNPTLSMAITMLISQRKRMHSRSVVRYSLDHGGLEPGSRKKSCTISPLTFTWADCPSSSTSYVETSTFIMKWSSK